MFDFKTETSPSPQTYSPGNGISNDRIRKIMQVHVSSKQMELDQQVAAGNKVIKRHSDRYYQGEE